MKPPDNLNCNIYVDEPNEEKLYQLLATNCGLDLKTNSAGDNEVLVFKNYDAKTERKPFPDTFLNFAKIIEVHSVGAKDIAKQVQFINSILTTLWNNNIPAVATCDYEDLLLHKGGYNQPQLPWPAEYDADNELLHKIIDHLYEKLNITAVKLERENGCQMEVGGRNFAYRTEVIIYSSDIACNAYAPMTISKEDLAKTAEFIARANYGMLFGHFQLDYHTGTFRYHTGLEWKGELDLNRVGDKVISAAGVMDLYIKYLRQMLHEDLDSEEAIRRVGGLE